MKLRNTKYLQILIGLLLIIFNNSLLTIGIIAVSCVLLLIGFIGLLFKNLNSLKYIIIGALLIVLSQFFTTFIVNTFYLIVSLISFSVFIFSCKQFRSRVFSFPIGISSLLIGIAFMTMFLVPQLESALAIFVGIILLFNGVRSNG